MTNNYYKEEQFLYDFDLHNRKAISRVIKKHPTFYSIVKRGDGEGIPHYGLKCEVIDKLNEMFGYHNNFFITNELEQKFNPFISEWDRSRSQYVYYTLDICVILFNKPRQPVILDIEIDGENHYRKKQMLKDEVRDVLLNERYNVHTERVDVSDPSFKRILSYLCNRIAPQCH